MTTTTTSGTLTLRCHVCKKPVTDTVTGYICIDRDEIHRRRKLIAEWQARNPGPLISGPGLLDYPERARWHIYHRACDPHTDPQNDYWFDISRARTYPDLLGWTAHLFGKRWFVHTNWGEFLYNILNANGWRQS